MNMTALFIFLCDLTLASPISCRKAKKQEGAALPAQNSTHGAVSEAIPTPRPEGSKEDTIEKKAPAGPVNIELTLERLKNGFSALEEAVQRIPRESFDPEAIVQKAEGDGIKLFEWVWHETRFIPYRGCLRGPVGVLMDRQGNSLDRSLLLCELLKLAGYEARLGRRHLSEEEARRLLGKVESRGGGERTASVSRTPSFEKGLVDFYAQNYKLDKETLLRTISQAQRRLENEIQEIRSKHKQVATEILAVLKDVREKSREGENVVGQDWKDHWWVQLEKEGQWVDLDPSLPSWTPGQRFGEPDKTLEPGQIDEELYHTIEIRLIAEQFDTGDLKERLVFEHAVVP